MARTSVNGATVAIASTYGANKTLSAISNAVNAVGTLEASHGVVVNDILEVISGWQRLDRRILRISAVATNDVTMSGADTSDTNLYPPGTGIGTIREITAWTQIGQVLSWESSGGEQQFRSYQYLDQDLESSSVAARTASNVTLTLHDDLAAAHVAVIRAAEASGANIALRLIGRDSRKLYANAVWTMAYFPVLEVNDIWKRTINLAIQGVPTEYVT